MGLACVNGPAAVSPSTSPLSRRSCGDPFYPVPPKSRRKLCYPVVFSRSQALPVFLPHFFPFLFACKLLASSSRPSPSTLHTQTSTGQPEDTIGRIPPASKAPEETSYFAVPSKLSYEDELHALKLKHKLQTHHAEPSFLQHAAAKLLLLPTAFLDLFRHRAMVSIKTEPLRRSARLSEKNHQNPPPAFACLNTIWRVCRSVLLGMLVIALIYLASGMSFHDRNEGHDRGAVADHNTRVKQARYDAWHALDWEREACKQLMAAKKERDQASVEGRMEAEDRVNKTQLKYDEVHGKREEIDAALKAKGLYPGFKVVSAEKYEADRTRLSPDYFVQGRAAVEAHFPCTPPRDAELIDHGQEQDGHGGESAHKMA